MRIHNKLKAQPHCCQQLIDHGEVKLVPVQSLHIYVLASLLQESTLHGEAQTET